MTGRRRLDFDRIDAIMPDVDRLLDGHTTSGGWTLGMICDHLTRAIRSTLLGRRAGTPATPGQDEARAGFFRDRAFPEGRPVPLPVLEPDPDADARDAAEALRGAIARLDAFEGPWSTHMLLGAMSRDEWLQFHCVHCAHHLSFAHPA
jgi:hypothetical protein